MVRKSSEEHDGFWRNIKGYAEVEDSSALPQDFIDLI